MIFFISAGTCNKDNHNISDEFEFLPNLTPDLVQIDTELESSW